ncbi:uncharacterized protein LOC111040631 [Myzus persicae]|uniref:uncharacterized protein LOC111040631 n=1 Tax=Myzus persicae TaxID=13164 RepID=UPI000B933827|nr:uncharacterized protein LOC111040631 [Myzus persicae]
MTVNPNTDELRKWTRKIDALRGSLEDYNLFASQYSNETMHISQVKVRLEEVAGFSEKFEEYQAQLEMLDEKKDSEWVCIRRIFRNRLCDVKAALLRIVDEHATNADHVSSPSISSLTSQHPGTLNSIRYPPCVLPTFNGDWQQWSSFIDTFNSMFHNDHSKLPLVQRFHYLKSCLSGQASDVIKSIPTTAEHYQHAYDLLVNRYENKSAIIQSHIRSLLDTPKVVTPSTSELQKLHHHISSNINALKSLKQPVDKWDAWLVTLLCSRMDSATVGEWYLQYKSKELPSYEDVEQFLANRITAYEAGDINCKSHEAKKVPNRSSNNKVHDKKALFIKSKEKGGGKCPLCSEHHKLYSCSKFNSMNTTERRNVVIKSKLCFNCLSFGHQVSTCFFPPCPSCGEKHNSKLHESQTNTTNTHAPTTSDDDTPQPHATTMYTEIGVTSAENLNVLLATAIVNICDNFGRMHSCRAVLDSGSQLNFVTNSCAKRLNLSMTSNALNIVGVSAMASTAKQLQDTILCSRFGDFKTNIKFYSLQTIVSALPSQLLIRDRLKMPDNILNQLADPNFHIPGPIDVLLGADIFFDIFYGDKVPLSNLAVLNRTKLGWIVTGKISTVSPSNTLPNLMINNQSALSFFVSKTNQRILEELKAEEHFKSSFSRHCSGRFMVKLPMAQDPKVLGDSLDMARKRFLNLERRLIKDKPLAEQYDKFISEYISLGHMELASPIIDKPTFYLPHHPVFKSDSTTTKMRVVFDGSATTRSGLSLNNIMLRGPKMQPDIFNILLRFRLHPVALTADVEKMYRQVLVAEEDCELQRIVYRSQPGEPLRHYKLKTVTYGTKSASFLATRCLHELGAPIKTTPIGRVICQDFYVDDLISGGNTDQECYDIHKQVHSILGNAGFPLRKWCSSSVTLFNSLPHTQNDPNFMVNLTETEVLSALGLLWQPSIDSFRFTTKNWTPPIHMTKRTLLSDINSVYDPLGLISSVLIKGKIFIQQVWSLKLGWDDPLSEDLRSKWTKFYLSLVVLNDLITPRLALLADSASYEIHGFCDASQHAYGACIYIRSIKPSGNADIRLYTARSRVAPIKTTTIPRLELCGALLLSELAAEVKNEFSKINMALPTENIHLWTDSTIVLAWLTSMKPLQVYVANRVAQINELSCETQWHHTPTTNNPADLISRGIDVSALPSCQLWWDGPEWLRLPSSHWPTNPALPSDLPEVRTIKLALVATAVDNPMWILKRYSNWFTLLRVTALVRRFMSNCKAKISNKERVGGFISMEEINSAKTYWTVRSQSESFPNELSSLKAGQLVHRGSCLKALSPFIDDQGLIRVGGRLNNAQISYNTKHPIVLSSRSYVTKLIFHYEHRRLMHIGPQGLLSHISNSYWIIRGRIISRKTVNDCHQCFRAAPKFMSPYMAHLPKERVTIARPFARSGLDFCGPIMIRSGRRKVSPTKSYVCVFVCMVTRAVHLELVSSLSSEDFLATLSRFMARRGQCSSLYSDNGTNFVGANRILQAHHKDNIINNYLNNNCIQWKFIPAAAPHFGGLWEAAVQAAKRHLHRVSQGVLLTYDETTTLLCKVEAALNSRPLTPMPSDPADLSVLTPGHFLVGSSLMLPPEPDYSLIPQNRLRRFKLMEAQFQNFWKRWLSEYLPQCQKKGKWLKRTRNAVVGDIAILKNELLPPLQWPLVRITEVHPGQDGIVRAVTVRNSSGQQFSRPVVKLAFLPTHEDEDGA